VGDASGPRGERDGALTWLVAGAVGLAFALFVLPEVPGEGFLEFRPRAPRGKLSLTAFGPTVRWTPTAVHVALVGERLLAGGIWLWVLRYLIVQVVKDLNEWRRRPEAGSIGLWRPALELVDLAGILALADFLASRAVGHLFLVGAARPAALSPVQALYFAVTTLSTVGLGDVRPADDAGRILVTAQVAIGFGVVAMTLLPTLSELLTRTSTRASTAPSEPRERAGAGADPTVERPNAAR
jgi:hypothetical protein